jgi:alcohol dehydrogenase (cytochrome c)
LCVLAVVAVTAVAQGQAPSDGAARADWPHYGGTQSAWRYSALDQINTETVQNLAPVWMFQTGDYADGLHSTPLVVDGVMYLITPRNWVFALDAATGRVLWQHKPMAPQPGPAGGQTFVLNRGVAVTDGKVFYGSTDNFLVALDQRSGREVWRVSIDDPGQCGCNVTSAPLVARDKVIVGGTGGELAHRGYLTAFHAKTGRLAWRFHVIPAPGEKGNETWTGDSWKTGGGAPWMTGSYDPELNLVYWGTGNASGDFYAGDRAAGADLSRDTNLYTNSVVALDADTGALRWYHQEVPADVWDYDAAYEAILFDRIVDGRPRRLLVHMNKSGLTFVLDRLTGDVVNVFSVPEVRTWISGVTETGELMGRNDPELGNPVNICPSVAGAKSWNQMAYSPRTGLLYTPTIELCNVITASRQQPQEGRFYTNGSFTLNLPPDRSTYSHIDAWDPITGRRVWSVPYKYLLLASMLATAGDLVFTGDPEGNFFALDARTGTQLWSHQTGAGHRGSAISYSVNGRQFIATPTGWQQSIAGGFASRVFPDQTFRMGSTLVAFALPEQPR